jgi:hypothetical protein
MVGNRFGRKKRIRVGNEAKLDKKKQQSSVKYCRRNNAQELGTSTGRATLALLRSYFSSLVLTTTYIIYFISLTPQASFVKGLFLFQWRLALARRISAHSSCLFCVPSTVLQGESLVVTCFDLCHTIGAGHNGADVVGKGKVTGP